MLICLFWSYFGIGKTKQHFEFCYTQRCLRVWYIIWNMEQQILIKLVYKIPLINITVTTVRKARSKLCKFKVCVAFRGSTVPFFQ